jgi:hypothetical protein
MTLDQIDEKFRFKTTTSMSVERENQILLDTLEEFAGAGGWFLDLTNMEFSALGNKSYDIYGIPRGSEVSYQQFLYDYVYLEDQALIEQIRMRLISGESPINWNHRIIKQDTGEIKMLSSLVYRVENANKELIGFRGITMYAQN